MKLKFRLIDEASLGMENLQEEKVTVDRTAAELVREKIGLF